MILRKIIKIVATRCKILRLKCTKFDFGWGSAPDPAGGAYSALLLREGRGREGEGKGREKGGKREGEGKGRDPPAVNPLLLKNPGYGPALACVHIALCCGDNYFVVISFLVVHTMYRVTPGSAVWSYLIWGIVLAKI